MQLSYFWYASFQSLIPELTWSSHLQVGNQMPIPVSVKITLIYSFELVHGQYCQGYLKDIISVLVCKFILKATQLFILNTFGESRGMLVTLGCTINKMEEVVWKLVKPSTGQWRTNFHTEDANLKARTERTGHLQPQGAPCTPQL